MKYLKQMAFALSLIGATSVQATVFNVNNATPSPGEYFNISDAITAASPGDTLYLAATNLSYGDVNLDKQMHLIGPGFKINAGFLGAYAELGVVTLVDGVATQGTSIQSIRLDRFELNDPSGTAIPFQNILLQRCLIEGFIYATNDVFSNSVVEGCTFTSGSFNFYPSTFSNLTVQNNVFEGVIQGLNGSTIIQNVFLGPGSIAWYVSVTSSSFINNIVLGRNVNIPIGTNVVTGNCSFGGSNNTFQGVEMNFEDVDPEFVNHDGSGFSFEADFDLAGTSPLIAAGVGGEDVGLTGGVGVYRKDGEPTIPVIRTVNIPGGTTVPANATFNINIISEAHE